MTNIKHMQVVYLNTVDEARAKLKEANTTADTFYYLIIGGELCFDADAIRKIVKGAAADMDNVTWSGKPNVMGDLAAPVLGRMKRIKGAKLGKFDIRVVGWSEYFEPKLIQEIKANMDIFGGDKYATVSA